MPVFMDDPSILTKERLKSELLANNVELPGGNPPRDVYVQLYVKTLSAQSHGNDTALDAFSSDEELPPPVVSRKSRSSGRKSAAAQLETLDVTLLTDEALRDQLLLHGLHPGPIVSSTRKLYEKKLQKLQDKGEPPSELQKNHNSGDAGLYSDQEEELIAGPGPTPAPDPSPDPEPDLEPVHEQEVTGRSRRNNTSQRRSSSQHSATKTVQQVDIVEEVEKMRTAPPPEKDAAVPELIVTGLTASCRRPIKGAAGRPVKPADLRQSAHTEIKVSNSAFSSVNSAPFPSNGSDPALLYTTAPPVSAPAPEAGTTSTHQAKARAGMSWGKKLLLWAVLAGFLFLMYQAMETNSAAPFEENPEL